MVIRGFLLIGLLVAMVISVPARGQQPAAPPGAEDKDRATVHVSVRNATGAPLSVPAEVRLRQRAGSVLLTTTARPGEGAVFRNLPPGEYALEVVAEGFKPVSQDATLRGDSAAQQLFVHLLPVSAPEPAAVVRPPVLPPKAAKEVQEAVFALSSGDLDAAQKRLQKAEKAAPNHPEVQYLLGMVQLRRDDAPGARQRFEQAIATYPQHVGALSALGRLLLQQGDLAGAANSLERALVVDGSSADNHSLLASVLLQLQQLDQARYHVQQALDISGNRKPDARLLLAQILSARGEVREALQTLERFVADFPAHPGAQKARKMMTDLRGDPGAAAASLARESGASDPASPVARASSGTGSKSTGMLSFAAPPSSADAEGPPVREWAPKDVDEVPPAVFRDVACPQAKVIEQVGLRVLDLMNNLRDVNAIEDVVHTSVDSKGRLGRSETGRYEYMFSIQHPRQGILSVEEYRNGGGGSMVGGVTATGLATMALIFHPYYAGDFEMKCEGMGNWKGEAVWFVHFRQHANKLSRLRAYRINGKSIRVPLKGRAWIAANSFQILRLETDLVAPMPEIKYEQEHMVVEYGPVEFRERNHVFWLPTFADVYAHERGRRWHRRHALSNYVHFSVDTKQKIADPKSAAAPPTEEPNKPPQSQR